MPAETRAAEAREEVLSLWPIERRLLAYLDQHGATHRAYIVRDLAPEDSRSNTRKGGGGSNGGVPLLMGSWCRRLIKAGWVVSETCQRGFYRSHAITAAGRTRLRSDA